MTQAAMEEAHRVLARYDLAVQAVSLLQDEGEKAVWVVETGTDRFGLKRLPHPFGKSLFVTAAQHYLRHRGVRVPRVVPATGGELVVEHDGLAYSVTEWLPGARRPSLAVPDDRAAIVRALAGMHACSRGYSPPPAATVSSKLGRWHAHYQRMLDDLREWKAVAGQNPEVPAYRAFLAAVDHFADQAARAIAALASSHYDEWCAKAEAEGQLSHQDYGDTNTLFAGDGLLYIIDFDSLTHDLPVRDLRKLINKLMKTAGEWDLRCLSTVLDQYTAEYPFTGDEMSVLLIDLRFPHLFHNAAKNCFRKGKQSAGEIQKLTAVDLSKEGVLADYEKGLGL